MACLVRTALLAALTAVALVVAACGSGDTEAKNEYVGSVNRAQSEFQRTFEKLLPQITETSTPKEDQQTLTRFREAVDAIVADLKGIKAPEEVTALHGELVGEVSRYGTEIDTARKAFRSSDPKVIISANKKFSTAMRQTSQDITATIDQINRKLQED